MIQFVDGIKPLWEDEKNKTGGRWSIRIPKTHSNKFWEDLLLAMIGEQFSNAEEINGIMISLKPNFDTIQIWNRNSKESENVKNDLLKILKIEEGMKIDYDNFAEILSQPPKEKEQKSDRFEFSRGGGDDDNGGFRGRGGRGGRARGRGRGEYNNDFRQ